VLSGRRSLRRGAWRALVSCAFSVSLSASDLENLAAFDAAPGDESRIIAYIAERVGGDQQIDSTGSLTVSFGSGAPHILLVAGVDEPGFVVSGIDDEGYLRLEPLAEPRPHYNFDKFFTGQHVHVTTRAGKSIPGAVAAPSVHFASSRGYSSSSPKGLFVDIGASGSQQVADAGVAILDRVTLAKQPQWLGSDFFGSAWLSSRSGAAILLALADHLKNEPATGKVTLAFATQQHYHNAGLSRILKRTKADRVIFLAPHGEETSEVAPASGYSSTLADELRNLSDSSGQKFKKRSTPNFSFGPFGNAEVWPNPQESVVLLPAVRNGGTPVASVSVQELARLVNLLEAVIGLQPRSIQAIGQQFRLAGPELESPPQDELSKFEQTVTSFVETGGVSGAEKPVRDRILEIIRSIGVTESQIDEKGNLVVRLGKGESPSAIFIAHMDEIGFAVQRISSSGAILTDTKGGGDTDLFAWHPMTIHTANGPVPAQMTRHGNIELGAASADEVAAIGVAAEDSVTVPKTYTRLLGSRVSARSLDDRLGCAVLVEALRQLALDARNSAGSVWFVFSVEEEVGLVGAEYVAANSSPTRVYAVDTFVTSDTPLEDRRIAYARLGAGPVLRALDNSGLTPRAEVERVAEIARRNSIPIQIGVTAGGNDGSKFTALGAVNIPIGFPLRYAHTPAETADLRDAEAAVELIVLLALEEL
jgi:putative aminopeptidase FrvX